MSAVALLHPKLEALLAERVRRIQSADEARELIKKWAGRRDNAEGLLALGRQDRRFVGFKDTAADIADIARFARVFVDRLEARAAELDQDGSGLDS